MMRELAPQTKDGGYSRPQYTFTSQIGDASFPVSIELLPGACGSCHADQRRFYRIVCMCYMCVCARHASAESLVLSTPAKLWHAGISSKQLDQAQTHRQHVCSNGASSLFNYTSCIMSISSCMLHPSSCTTRSPRLQAESGRYHVYLGNACPWCHRVMLALVLRGLLPHIGVTHAVDDAERASRGGWVFDTPEPVFCASDLRCAASLRCFVCV